MSDQDKRFAAEAALVELRDGIRLGLGTGSTARHFVDLVGERVRNGFTCICVPTSEATRAQAESLGIPLTDLDSLEKLDLTVDGADEIDPERRLIKGAGGALLREKIVAAASDRMVVIADGSKQVDQLGRFPLSIEINPFAWQTTLRAVLQVAREHGCAGEIEERQTEGGEKYVTDGGHLIVDASFGRISDANGLSRDLLDIPGVVQHGLFLNMCDAAYVAENGNVTKLGD